MIEKQLISHQLNDGGLADCVIGQHLLVVHKMHLYQYNFQFELLNSTPLEMPMNSIGIHPKNQSLFAIGGTRVDIFDDIDMVNPTLVTTLNGQINQIQYAPSGKYMGIASEENVLTIFTQDTNKITKCRPGHDGMTLGCVFDPNDQFVGSIGCDGCFILYQLSEVPKLLGRYTISGQHSPDGTQRMKASWHPSGNFVCLPGKLNLQYINTEDDCGDLQICYQIMHETEICIVLWISEIGVITGSQKGELKMWHFKSFIDVSLHWKLNIDAVPLSFQIHDDQLFILDDKGRISVTKLDSPLTDYQKIYSSKENALQDLLNRKTNKEHKIVRQDSEEDIIQEDQKDLHEIPLQKMGNEQSDNLMQDIVRPGSSDTHKGRRYLCYNHIGTIIECKNTKIIEFEFFDSTFHRKFKLENGENYSLATMNYRGCVVACKGPNDLNKDGYSENEKSIIYFEQFINSRDSLQIELPEEEGVELLTISSDWFAVWSDFGIVRIFGFYGVELQQFQTNRPIVSMCSYENQLCLVYHDTPTMLGNQMLKAKIYDLEQQTSIEIDLFLSAFTTLRWIGYSQEGLLATQDSKGSVRVLENNNRNWIEILCDKKMWVFGISDYKVEGLKSDEGILATQKYNIISLDFNIQGLHSYNENEKISKMISQQNVKQLIYSHEQYRWKHFGHLYECRNETQEILHKFTQNMYDENKLNQLEQQLKKLRFELFSQLLAISVEKGLEYFKFNIRDEMEMNQIIALLEKQKDKSDQITKCIQQLKLMQRHRILQKQQVIIPNKPQSPKRTGFGLQKPPPNNMPPKQPEQLVIHKQPTQVQEDFNEEEENPFLNSGQKQLPSIFEMNERSNGKRKPMAFGSQNLKRKL